MLEHLQRSALVSGVLVCKRIILTLQNASLSSLNGRQQPVSIHLLRRRHQNSRSHSNRIESEKKELILIESRETKIFKLPQLYLIDFRIPSRIQKTLELKIDKVDFVSIKSPR